jgi:hypothetical protein
LIFRLIIFKLKTVISQFFFIKNLISLILIEFERAHSLEITYSSIFTIEEYSSILLFHTFLSTRIEANSIRMLCNSISYWINIINFILIKKYWFILRFIFITSGNFRFISILCKYLVTNFLWFLFWCYSLITLLDHSSMLSITLIWFLFIIIIF